MDLQYVQVKRMTSMTGNLNFFYIRESTSVREVWYCMSKKSCPFARSEYTKKIEQDFLDMLYEQ